MKNKRYKNKRKDEWEPELKQFNLESYVNPDSIKTKISQNMLQISMIVDSKVNCNVRVSICVTEQKNEFNVPVMFYTPNAEDYV